MTSAKARLRATAAAAVATRGLVLGLALGAGAGLAACGDNTFRDGEPLAHATDLTIVAHQDDDLLFMQPDLYDAVRHGTGVTNVYVTAGNGTQGVDYAEQRYGALMDAYGALAGDTDWSCGWIKLGAIEAEHCRLDGENLSLVFLGYPDGGVEGEATDSLLHLWEGKVTTVGSVARRPSTFDQTSLIAVVTEIIDATAPTTIRTLEIAATHGHDHSDHMLVGALAVLATARSAVDPALVSYRGYDTTDDPANADPALYARSGEILGHYEACVGHCGACGTSCPLPTIDPSHQQWLDRRYAIAMRPTGDGPLALDAGCILAPHVGENPVIGDCAAAPVWHLDPHGTLRTDDDVCLEVFLTGEIIANTCRDAGVAGRFFLDDDGHLWTGIVPAQQDDMTLAHLDCLGSAGGRPRAGLCGNGQAPTWQLARAMTTTPRAATGLTAAGRALRIAAFPQGPQVCALEPAGLLCASLAATGAVSPAVRLDSAAAPLAIEPDSLMLGDVDGDGLTDACGQDATGILCATAASGYHAVRWTTVLGASGASPAAAAASAASLAIAADGQICGLAGPGVVCVAEGATAITNVLSTSPAATAALWIADLDGDGRPDWCAATTAGPACGLAADRAVTTTGVSWGYSFGAVTQASAADGALPDTDTAAIVDVDGDGRDDLCEIRDGAISCAPSQGHGFGPRSPVALLPAGMTPTALVVERAGTGSAPRLCAADATTFACTN